MSGLRRQEKKNPTLRMWENIVCSTLVEGSCYFRPQILILHVKILPGVTPKDRLFCALMFLLSPADPKVGWTGSQLGWSSTFKRDKSAICDAKAHTSENGNMRNAKPKQTPMKTATLSEKIFGTISQHKDLEMQTGKHL